MKKKVIISLATSLSALVALGVATGLAGQKAVGVRADYQKDFVAAPSASASTMRYWFIQNDGDFWGGEPVLGIHAWGGTTDNYYLMSATTSYENAGQSFFYVDIPVDCTSFQLLRCAKGTTVGANKTIWNDSGTYSVSVYKPSALHWCGGYMGLATLSNSPCNNPRPSANLLAKVLEGYNVCLANDLNGYGAASALYTNWISQYDSGIWGDWESVTINDYASGSYSENEDSYDGLPKSATFSVKAKWEGLATKAGIDPNNGSEVANASEVSVIGDRNSSFTVPAVLVIGGVSVLGAGMLLLRKRKAE